MTDTLACCALNARGEICAQPATFACSELHALCPNHAVKTTGRRKTDRRCRVCLREGHINDVIAMKDIRRSVTTTATAATPVIPGECVTAYDSVHRCRRRAIFSCRNGHGSCRGHVGLRIDEPATLRRSCSICAAELHPADQVELGALTGTT
jgi:hypothetical protein